MLVYRHGTIRTPDSSVAGIALGNKSMGESLDRFRAAAADYVEAAGKSAAVMSALGVT
jgi:hypothetical protein